MAFQPLTTEQWLAVWRTLFDASFTVPLETEAGGLGVDPFAMQAAIFARVDAAANETFGRLYIRQHSTQTADPASGAARAATTLVIERTGSTAIGLPFAQGTEFLAHLRAPTGEQIDGVRFRLISDVELPAGAPSVEVMVEASRVGFASNVSADSIDAFAPRGSARITSAIVGSGNQLFDRGGLFGGDRLTTQMIGQFVRLVGGPDSGAVRRITSVTLPTEATPVAVAVLSGAALTPVTLSYADVVEFADLGLTVRQPSAATGGRDGELDMLGEERNIPRQSGESDAAYRQRIVTLPDVVSPGAIMRACSRILSPLGIAWRLMETRDTSGLRGAVAGLDPCDWGSVADGLVTIGDRASVRYFVILVGLGDQGEFGAFCDTYVVPTVNACDVAFCDGRPVTYESAIGSLWADVNARRGAGIGFRIVRSATL